MTIEMIETAIRILPVMIALLALFMVIYFGRTYHPVKALQKTYIRIDGLLHEKKRFFDYLINDDKSSDMEVVMSGISLKCERCDRVMVMKKYTQGYLISHSKNGVFKI